MWIDSLYVRHHSITTMFFAEEVLNNQKGLPLNKGTKLKTQELIRKGVV